MRQVVDGLKGRILNGGDSLDHKVERCVIGTMSPHTALDHFAPGVLAILPGDREDRSCCHEFCVMGERQAYCVSGITHARHSPACHRDAPSEAHPDSVVLVDDESYAVVSRIRDLTVKMQPGDTETIQLAQRLVEEHVDIDRVLAAAIP